MSRDLAIDLGTANVLVYAEGKGVVVNEPTVIAVNQRSGDVLAMGSEAYAMIGRTPGHIVADRPLRGGAINDFDTTTRLLRLVLQRAGVGRLSRPRVLICVPSALTEVERRAVEEAATQAGAASAYLLEEPMAAAIGVGLPVQEPIGSMVIDVGGGTTEVCIMSLGGIVASNSVRVGGFDLDATIQHYVRREYALMIGERTAEDLKKAIGSAYPWTDIEPEAEVRGRELSSGLPQTVKITAAELRAAMAEQLTAIVEATIDVLASCPAELSPDIIDRGMYLVGGGALLHGLADRLAAETDVAVHMVDEPLEVVVRGAGRAPGGGGGGGGGGAGPAGRGPAAGGGGGGGGPPPPPPPGRRRVAEGDP